MKALLDRIRTRLVPAVLTATGVTLVAAGLLSYTGPVDAGPGPTPTPGSTSTATSPSPAPTATTAPSASSSSPASPSASAISDRVATRVVVRALGIDLPVIRPAGGSDTYPLCDVAMYIQQLGQPGQGRATYLYAHARDGMFGPIYERAIVRREPESLHGLLVEVYTSDERLYLYEIVEVRLGQTRLDDAFAVATEQVWLQTSEGPSGTPGKTQAIARFLSSGPADPADAHPSAKPVECA